MQTSPSILYHYTTAHGLRCIVESKSIWASDFRFLNDASEFQHGRSIFEKIFREMHQTLPSAAAKRIDDGLGEMADPQFHVLVASFCTCSDLLSQWRGYNGGEGYALGIDAGWLSRNALEQGFTLERLEYEAGAQQSAVAAGFHLLRNELQRLGDSEEATRWLENWWEHSLRRMAALKNRHFLEKKVNIGLCV